MLVDVPNWPLWTIIEIVGGEAVGELRLADALVRRGQPSRGLAAEAAWVYGSVEDLVLDRGRVFSPAADMIVSRGSGFSGIVDHVRLHRGTSYVEGFLLDSGGAVLAGAWAAQADQVVYGPAGSTYLGVPLAEPFRRAVTRRSGAASVIHGQELDLWRLLQHGFPSNAVLSLGRPRTVNE